MQKVLSPLRERYFLVSARKYPKNRPGGGAEVDSFRDCGACLPFFLGIKTALPPDPDGIKLRNNTFLVYAELNSTFVMMHRFWFLGIRNQANFIIKTKKFANKGYTKLNIYATL